MASAILILWAAAFTRAIYDPTFKPPEGFGEVALAAATYLFGSGLLKTRGDDNDDDKEIEGGDE